MGLYGVNPEYVEEAEDEDSEARYSCSICGEAIELADDIYMISVYSVCINPKSVHYEPVLAEDGDYAYEPCYLCEDCEKNMVEDLHGRVEDIPPMEDQYAVIECSTCSSGIRKDESAGIVTLGQLQISGRSPSEIDSSATFQCMESNPRVICISCMNILNKDVAELWNDRITQNDECSEGTHLRCWRHGCNADGNCGRK